MRKGNSLCAAVVFLFLFFFSTSFAQSPKPFKGSAPIYQNTFDLGAGGASLTRATQDGMLLSNPSLPAMGAGFLRWIYLRGALHGGAAPTSTLAKLTRGGAIDPADIAKATRASLHLGQDVSLGAMTTVGGAMGFVTSRVDLEGKGVDAQGIPTIETFVTGYGGMTGAASKSFGDWLGVGATVKGVTGVQAAVSASGADVVDQAALQQRALSSIKKGSGFGGDLGFIFQKRTKGFDLRLGTTVADVGGTKFSGGLDPWRQTVNMGVGATVHTKSEAVHCAYDYRDLTNAYGQTAKERSYVGCRLVIAKFVAFGLGYGQGELSYGALVNLFIMRLEMGSYGRSFGTPFGTKTRRAYYLAFGFEMP